MAKNAGLVLATRNARILGKDYVAAEATLPDDTVDYNAEWPGFEDLGYTNGGIGTTISVDRGTINVDQLFQPVQRPITGGAVRFDTNLAQFSPENLQMAAGVGTFADPVAPGAGTRGHTEFTIGAEFEENEYTVAFEALQRNGEAFRALIGRAQVISSPNPRLGQADANAQIAFEVEALPADDPTDHELAYFRSIIPAEAA